MPLMPLERFMPFMSGGLLSVPQGAIPLLIGCTKTFRGQLDVMISALSALKNMATNEDSVNQIVQLGGLELTVGALRDHIDNAVRIPSLDMEEGRQEEHPSGPPRRLTPFPPPLLGIYHSCWSAPPSRS